MRAIRREVRVRCPRDHAFRVFTERVDDWWPASHRAFPGSVLRLEEAGPDGALVERGPGGEERVLGRVTAWEPPERLVLAWRLGSPDRPTLAEVRFVDEGDATRVVVVHRDAEPPLDDWPRTSRLYERSWGHVLEALAHHLTPESP